MFCFIFFSLKQSVGRAFRQLYHFCISFVTSAYRNPDFYNYRVLSKVIYNSLALVFLAVAFGVSLHNSESRKNVSLEECQNICNLTDNYLQNGFFQNYTFFVHTVNLSCYFFARVEGIEKHTYNITKVYPNYREKNPKHPG